MQRILMLLAVLLLLPLTGIAEPGRAGGRVVVLGFDGADARTTKAMIEEGQLPNLKRLAEQGTFAPLRSTNPAESSAGWAAINTGTGPDRNGVPSFFGREISSYDGLPSVAPFHIRTVERKTSEMRLQGLLGLLAGRDTTTLAAAAGGAVLVAFLVLLGLILRLRRGIAVVLSIVFAAVGAWATTRLRAYVPASIPNITESCVELDGFWKAAGEQGAKTIVLDAALAFGKPEVENVRLLGGLGLPDCRGDIGQWFLYSTDDLVMGVWPNPDSSGTGSGETYKVQWRDGKIQAKLPGPLLFWDQARLREELDAVETGLNDPDLGYEKSKELRAKQEELKQALQDFDSNSNRATAELSVERAGDKRVRVTIGKESHEVEQGQWSDWYHVAFEINPLISVHAVTRVHLLSADEPFELYVSTLDIDPENPPFWQPISTPSSFSGELAKWADGPYETVGWACMTNQIKDKKLPIEVFLQDVEFTMAWRERLTYAALARDDWSLLFSVFTTPDRIQHMLYKYYDPEHPKHVPADAEREVTFFGEKTTLAGVIPVIYRQIDRIVGKVMQEYLKPDDTLLLCADHGFTSFRREMNVNNWLAEKGYLKLRDDLKSTRSSSLRESVDWSQTKAYCIGLGMVFVNQVGREPRGIVPAGEAPALLQAIARDFLEATDVPREGAAPVKVGHDAWIVEGLTGEFRDRCADLMLGFADNYRVSWSTAGGKVDLKTFKATDGGADRIGLDSVYLDNSNNWCGDHASVSPEVVKGIFFSSRPVVLPENGVDVTHIAPTVLDLLGLKIPPEFDKAPLARR